jgi:hypothetical protein
MKKLVSFELAKLLKKKEYQEKVNTKYGYCDGGEIDEFSTIFSDTYENFNLEFSERQKFINKNGIDELEEFSAPTIANVVMWLYEKHDTWIYSKRTWEIINDKDIDKFSPSINFNDTGFLEDIGYYDTPSEAYEAAIERILNEFL